MSVVDQLLEMGFEKELAEKAVAAGHTTLEGAMDWLVSQQDSSEHSAEKAAEAPSTANSFKCNDCGKLLRDENAVMFHASKTQHENFEESTESIKPLTEEERKEQAAKLKERIKASMASKAETEEKDKLEREKRRIQEGKLMLERREKQKEQEQLAAIAQRKRDKDEEKEAKARVLEQIRLDKEARKARAEGRAVDAAPVPAPTPTATPEPAKEYSKASIQVRLPDGSIVRQDFSAHEQLSAVRLWLQLNRPELGSAFNLLQPFPRKQLSEEDMEAPLSAHGLVPSGSLVVTRAQ